METRAVFFFFLVVSYLISIAAGFCKTVTMDPPEVNIKI